MDDDLDMQRSPRLSDICLECLCLHEKVDQLEHQVDQIQRLLTLLSLQVSAMKHDLFGEGKLVALDQNGDFTPEDR